jgi:hypothetical protein
MTSRENYLIILTFGYPLYGVNAGVFFIDFVLYCLVQWTVCTCCFYCKNIKRYRKQDVNTIVIYIDMYMHAESYLHPKFFSFLIRLKWLFNYEESYIHKFSLISGSLITPRKAFYNFLLLLCELFYIISSFSLLTFKWLTHNFFLKSNLMRRFSR